MLIIVGFLVVIISVIGATSVPTAAWVPSGSPTNWSSSAVPHWVRSWSAPGQAVKQTLQAMVGVFKGPRYKQQGLHRCPQPAL